MRFRQSVADIERRVRPSRLREVLDRGRDFLVALDQQHVARDQDATKRLRVGRRVGLVARGLGLQAPGQIAAEPVEKRIATFSHSAPNSGRDYGGGLRKGEAMRVPRLTLIIRLIKLLG